jgi:hypothetical protein
VSVAPKKEESIEESRDTDIGRLLSRFLFVMKASAGTVRDKALFCGDTLSGFDIIGAVELTG